MSEPLLAVEHVALGYGRRAVLEDVHFAVAQGEFWFLLGPNGAGKTTFLKAMMGLVPFRQGALRFHPSLAYPQRLGFVAQSTPLPTTLPVTVEEFLALGLVGLALGRRQRRERIQWALDKVHLPSFGPRQMAKLSGGQQQRVILARALVRYPLLLILDEPTNNLDFAAESAFLGCLAELNRQEKLTVIFVSHDLDIVRQYGTHVTLFHDGLAEAGPMEQMMTPERLHHAFRLGEPLDA